jgi:hypothetical protein
VARDYTAELGILEAMTPDQRQLYFQTEKLQSEESWLKFLIDSLRETDEQVAFFSQQAKAAIWDYEQLDIESALTRAESYVALAETAKQHRYKLSDIREQRARVQCQRKIVNQMTRKLEENSIEKPASSSHSAS